VEGFEGKEKSTSRTDSVESSPSGLARGIELVRRGGAVKDEGCRIQKLCLRKEKISTSTYLLEGP